MTGSGGNDIAMAPKPSGDEVLTVPAVGRERGTITETTAATSAATSGWMRSSGGHACPKATSHSCAELCLGARSGTSGMRNGSRSSMNTRSEPART